METDGTSRQRTLFAPGWRSESALRPSLDDALSETEHFFFTATRAMAACSAAKFPCSRASMRDRCSVVVLEWASIGL